MWDVIECPLALLFIAITMEDVMVENLELRDGEEVVLDVRCGCIKPNEDFATKTNEGSSPGAACP